MPERWYLFVQLEIPWELGPADGRYLLRGGGEEREPEHVVVLNTLGAMRRRERGLPARARRGREAQPQPKPEPEAVPVTRVTVIDPVPVAAQAQAKAWLEDLDVEHQLWATAAVVNRVLHAQRVAAADPYLHELAPAQALVARAGWGVGEQVADGLWEYARVLPRPKGSQPRSGRRVLALRPQERLTWLLGGREEPLLCEELALRARRDLDQGRLRHAALELRAAYETALGELEDERRQDLALRVAELRELDATFAHTVKASASPTSPPASSSPTSSSPASSPAASSRPDSPDEPAIRHALERLEAALRARSAGLKLG